MKFGLATFKTVLNKDTLIFNSLDVHKLKVKFEYD